MEKENHIQFKTRGDSTNQGKPRVYFCCHPDDFDMYFESVRNEILDKQNCAVYFYDNASSIPEQDRETDLLSIQLFVIPVTTNLLTKPSIAMDKDFPLALKNKIPVLPLIQERGLEELFVRKFGDMQYLDKTQRDTTAISYEEKLEKHLSAILLGDEMTEKIKNEFDAYIFLSYRKMDRKYAQELMRLIHKIDFCRDIAIWYDEFLTIGEDFNLNIESVMCDSKLFVLVVTPNLLRPNLRGEMNYVMKVEYPKAKIANKNIFPVEMVRTDRAELEKSYEDIPPCVDAHDEIALRNALFKTIQNISKRKHHTSQISEHNFLIGLAYLNGVDVEVDRERGLNLIELVANEGFVEAIETLVSMYRTGDSVERNYENAIMWQRKLVDYRKRRYDCSLKKCDGLLYLHSIWSLGDYLYDLHKLDDAKEVYFCAMDINEKIDKNYKSTQTEMCMGVSYGKIGKTLQIKGDLDEARTYYIKAFKVSKKVSNETGSVDALRDLSIAYDRLGSISEEEDKIIDAYVYYYESFKITEAIVVKYANSIDAKIDLADCRKNMGRVLKADGRLLEAKDSFEKALEIEKVIAEEMRTIESKRSVSTCYENIGDILMAESRYQEAKICYKNLLEIRKKIADETNAIDDRYNLAVSYDRIGDALETEKKLFKAEEYYKKSYEIRKKIATETDTIEGRRSLFVSYGKISSIKKVQGKLDEAENYSAEALKIAKMIVNQTNTLRSKKDLAIAYNKIADILEESGQLSEAKIYYREWKEITKTIADETNTIEARRNLAVCYEWFGDIALKSGAELFKVKQYYQESFEIMKAIADEVNTIIIRRGMSICYNKLGDILKMEGEYSQAEDKYRESLKICIALVNETNAITHKRDLSITYNKLGDVAEEDHRVTEAKNYYLKALELRIKIADDSKSLKAMDDLSISYRRLGYISAVDNQLEEAKNYFKKSIRMRVAISYEINTPESIQDLSKYYYNMGTVFKKLGLDSESSECYINAIKLLANL